MDDSVLLRLRSRVRDSVKKSKGKLNSSRFDTSDVIQEAMLQIWRDIEKSELSEKVFPQALVRRISRGHTAKMRRFHSADKRSFRKESSDADTCSIVDPALPIDHVERDEDVSMLRHAVKELNPVEKYIVYRRFFEGATFSSIGTDLDKPEAWIRRQYLKTIKKLKINIEHTPERS